MIGSFPLTQLQLYVFLYTLEGKCKIDGINPDDFEFNNQTGILTIKQSSGVSDFVKGLFSFIASFEEHDTDKFYVTLVLEVKVEKYRSVDDLRDLTEEKVNQIATAQAIEAALLEYNYQFNLATQTQMGFHELVYTATVTAISTVITMLATYGIGSMVSSLGSTSKAFISQKMTGPLGQALSGSFSAAGVAYSVVKEIGQELLLDPWIESTVSGLVRRAGGDAMMQMVLSSIAESGREALSGPLSNLFSSGSSQQSDLDQILDEYYYSQEKNPTIQEYLVIRNALQNEMTSSQTEGESQISLLRGANKVLSFVSLATGFAASFLLGPFGALAYTTLATYCLTEGISLKDMFKKAFNPVIVRISNSKVADYVRNNKKQVLLALGIGVASLGWMALQTLLPALSGFGVFGSLGIGFGGITIGMVDISNKEKDKHEIDEETKQLIDWYDNLPIDQRYQYGKKLPFEDEVINMDPTQFKTSYKGPFSQYFKNVKNRHNRYLGVKTVGKLLKIMKNMAYAGIIYKITQVYDEHGNRLKSGGIFVTNGKIKQKGPIRIGSAMVLQNRLKHYMYRSNYRVRNNFERALGDHPMGIKAFRIEILAVCKTEKELLSTEAFWQIYTNRISFGDGFDLAENNEFNPIIVGFSKGFSPYNIQKWEVMGLILQGKQKKEITAYYDDLYASHIQTKTLNRHLIRLFGTSDVKIIKLKILKPLLEVCFKRGFDPFEALTYLKGCGVEWYSTIKDHNGRINTLNDDAAEIFGDLRSGGQYNRWTAIRLKLFTEPYVRFLRSQGLLDIPTSLGAVRDSTGSFIKTALPYLEDYDFSIIEYLYAKGINPTEIAIAIGLCKADDSTQVKKESNSKIQSYLKHKYKLAFETAGARYNAKALRSFLRNHFIGDELYW